ncbi:hypothetical protein JKF63_05019 [Porcisia hertigi]|uniref:Uncharacterized protein n=1 Tax=Porcisia hertigi TaxID=2761500 RepID=A0A836LBE7_9TRYP|nr:hypothetical protein JKF63_05019 [Porcisia hertigi]
MCTPYTAIIEEHLLFIRARQLIVQALSSAGANGVPCGSSAPTQSSREHLEENVDSGDVCTSTRLAVLALPASLLHAWLRHTEAVEESNCTDVDANADVGATRLQTSGETWLSVQPALEYASLTYGPVHVINGLQWEEIKALYNAEQPRQKSLRESSASAVGPLSTRLTSPCILVHIVFLWIHEGRMYRLSPAQLPNVETKTRATPAPRLSPPPRATSAGLSVDPSSASLFTCYLTLEYPPGSQWPHRVPVPIAEPLLTRQELIELVRTTAKIHRHHPLRVAYRVWPQATPSMAPATPWSGGHTGTPSAATRAVVSAPTTRAPPLRALESNASMTEFIRDILSYGSTAVQIVAVRSSRVPVEYPSSKQHRAVNVSGQKKTSQRPSYLELNVPDVGEKSALPSTNGACGNEVERGRDWNDSVTRQMNASPVSCTARAQALSRMATAAGNKSGVDTAEPLSINNDAEGVCNSSEASTCTAHQEKTWQKPALNASPKAEDVAGMDCLGHASDSKASREDGPHPPLSDADEFNETWCSSDRHTEYVSGKGTIHDADLHQQDSQPTALKRTHIEENIQSHTCFGDSRGEEATPTRKKTSAHYPKQLSTVSFRNDHQANPLPHVCAPTPRPHQSPADSQDIYSGAAGEAITDRPPLASITQQRTTTSSCGSAVTADPAAMVFVRYDVDPTVVRISGPVSQTVLQHLQEVIFQRCCAHLCKDLDAPRPCFHAAQQPRHGGSGSGSTHLTKADTHSNDAYSAAVAASGGSCSMQGTGPPTAVHWPEYILPLYHYTFTRVEENALERCISEIMAVYQGLEQLPTKEADEWQRMVPSSAPAPGTLKEQQGIGHTA